LFDDEQDRKMQRNQLLAIVLMVALVLVWTQFFMPAPPKKPAPQTPVTAEMPAAPEDPAQTPETADAPAVDPASPLSWLPPAADMPADPAADEVTLKNDQLELVFTRVGARLKRATVILGKEGEDSRQLVPQPKPDTPDTAAEYPLGLRFGGQFWGDAANDRRWDAAVSPDGLEAVFTLEAPGRARVTKTFRLGAEGHTLDTRVGFANLGAEPQLLGLDTREPALALLWGPDVASGDLTKGASQHFVWRVGDGNTYKATTKLDAADPVERIMSPEWVAVWSAYFCVGLKPEFAGGQGWIEGRAGDFLVGVGAPREELAPGAEAAWAYKVYIGSTAVRDMAAGWPTLPSVQRFFTSVTLMDKFAKALLVVLNWCHDHVWANYGIAIILLTLLVRIAVFPLTYKSMLSMKRMQKLAPELERLKAECGEDQQEFQKRSMELYKERGVNPLGGCLPLFLQMPVFFALYRMLWSAFELRSAPFLWIADLSEADRLFTFPFTIPFISVDSLNLLPILSAVAMYASQKIMPPSGPVQNPQQKLMMNLMPFIFSVFMYNLASGLNLYILVSTLLGIAQNFVIQGANVSVEPVKKRTPRKARHFYDAAQAKKREMAKEIRREKEDKRSRNRKDKP